jgi:hypothetical protein
MIPPVHVGQNIWVLDLDDVCRRATVISLIDDWMGWAVVWRDRPAPACEQWTVSRLYWCPTTCIVGPAETAPLDRRAPQC